MTKLKVFSIKISDEMRVQIKTQAKKNKITMGEFIRKAINYFYDSTRKN